MRLWHTALISVLPKQQLLGQWRELNSIFKLKNKHVLINFVYDYPKTDLYVYSVLVVGEFIKRKYKVNLDNFYNYFGNIVFKPPEFFVPFDNKMTSRYLKQCLYNLQEKYDCGAITEDEWQKIKDRFVDFKLCALYHIRW